MIAVGGFSVPGKVFLLGEYAVLAGRPALVASVGPRFELSDSPFEGSQEFTPHPDSPAGRLAYRLGFHEPLHWRDPFRGAGGFGASTAQYLLLSKVAGEPGLSGLHEDWDRYRELSHRPGELAPSGADLLSQMNGGVVCFTPEPFSVLQLGPSLAALAPRLQVRVIQASQQPGRKVATHLHLSSLGNLETLARELEPILRSGIQAMEQGDVQGFGKALSHYGDRLAAFDLEDGATRRDRIALAGIPGVLGIKGAGALQADALVAAIDPTSFDSDSWMSRVSELGLVDRGIISGLEAGMGPGVS